MKRALAVVRNAYRARAYIRLSGFPTGVSDAGTGICCSSAIAARAGRLNGVCRREVGKISEHHGDV